MVWKEAVGRIGVEQLSEQTMPTLSDAEPRMVAEVVSELAKIPGDVTR